MPLFSVGYGKDNFDALIERIAPFNITHLADVRTNPYSRYQTDFRGKDFENAVNNAGLKYVFLGDRLGGKPNDPEVLTDGEIDWQKVRHAAWYVQALDKLVDAAENEKNRICLMCGCGLPQECHRGTKLCEYLLERGIDTVHVLPGGETILQSELREQWTSQLALF